MKNETTIKKQKVEARIPVHMHGMRKASHSILARQGAKGTVCDLRAETAGRKPADTLRHIDLFSGIGGFALAAERIWGSVEHTFCDIDPFAQAVLKKHWPNSKVYGDIRTLTNTESKREQQLAMERKQNKKAIVALRDSQIDLLTGGFPCQPFSVAGQRKGTGDDRYLWPEMLRVIREFNPRWVIAENVGGLVTWNNGMVLEQVHTDLESEGYEIQAFIIPAVAVNAPHRRDRVWIIAHSTSWQPGIATKRKGRKDTGRADSNATDASRSGRGGRSSEEHSASERELQPDQQKGSEARSESAGRDWDASWVETATTFCRVDDGIPRRLDRNGRLKALGNAIVPQVAEEIMRAIKLSE